jgi:transcriptional/translational regulatory protein YebC/TACO1
VSVEGLSDNRKRTARDVRSAFSKYGGALGEGGSVAFLFSRMGSIVYPAKAGSADAMLEAAIEAGAEEVLSTKASH